MSENVIRQDVVQIGWDVDNNPLRELIEAIRELTERLKGVKSSGIDKIAQTAQQAKTGVQGMGNSMSRTDKLIASMKSSMSQFDAAVAKVKSTLNGIKPADLVKKVKQLAQTKFNNFKQLAQTKLGNLKTNLTNVKNTLTGGQTGAKGLATALKNVAKISLVRLTSGVKTLSGNLKGAAKVGFAKLKDNLKKVGSALKDAAAWAGKAAAQLGEMALKGIAVGAAAAATGLAAVGTAAIKSYADYEQLVGGVETLFGAGGQSLEDYAKAAGTTTQAVSGEYGKMMAAQQAVFDNAAKAYTTAGLSANEYMETVTSFSASLIQSLGGDTQKAADYADMAIRDMSDNANKMGTDMSSIQDAYQGFAKQNFDMLDNLKLGYGGTKEEMQRLLSDAEKLTGKNLDISSYADIVEAIHAIQDEMGITGTTAKEAATTIQGSAASMKAAWSNFLTGLADENQDFDQLFDNLITSVETFGENLIPRIKILLPRLVQGVIQLTKTAVDYLPELLAELLPPLVNGALDLISSLITVTRSNSQMIVDLVTQVASKIIQALSNILPDILVLIVELVISLANAVSKELPTLIPIVVQACYDLVQRLVDLIPEFIDAAIALIMALADGIIQALPIVLEQAPKVIASLINGILSCLPKLIQAAIQLIQALVQGLIQNLPVLLQAALQMIMAIVQGIMNNLPLIIQSAITLINTLVQGITQMLPQLIMTAIQIIFALIVGILQMLPQIIQAGIQLLLSLIDGIIQMLPLLIQCAIYLIFALAQGLLQNLPTIIQAAIQIIVAIVFGLIQAIPKLIEAIPVIFTSFIEGLFSMDWLKVGWDLIKAIFTGLWEGIKSLGKSIWEGIKSIFKGKDAEVQLDGQTTGAAYAEGVKSGVDGVAVENTVASSFDMDLSSYGTNTMSTYTAGLSSGMGDISSMTAGMNTDFNTNLSFDLSGTGMSTMDTFSTGVSTGSQSALTGIDGLSMDITTGLTTDNTGAGLETLNSFGSGMTSAAPTVIASAQDTADSTKETFESLDLTNAGKNVMQGFLDGMSSMQSAVLAKAESIANGIKKTINSALDIHSPSGVTEWQAKMVGKGWIKGTDEIMPKVKDTALQLSRAYTPEDSGSVYNSTSNSSSSTTYSPQFNLTINGGGDDRTLARKVKRWVKEGIDESNASLLRRNRPLVEG